MCVIKAVDDTLLCWGYGIYGTNPVPAAGTFRSVVIGWQHGCAIRMDGTVACWGTTSYASAWTVPSSLNGKTVTKLAVNNYDTCARATDGSITCW